jgi:hypothetical protein
VITVVCHRVWTAARPVVHHALRHIGHAAGHVVTHPVALVVSIVCVAVPGAMWLLPPVASAITWSQPPAAPIVGAAFIPPRSAVAPQSGRERVPFLIPTAPLLGTPPAALPSASRPGLPLAAFLPPDSVPVPEPSTAVVFGFGVLVLMWIRRRVR